MEPVLLTAASGLANRLRALVGARALAEGLGADLCVDWPRNGACDAGFGDLFTADGWRDVRFVEPAEIDRLAGGGAAVVIDGCPWFTEIWSRHGRDLCGRGDFCRRAVELLRALRPVSEVQRQIDAFLEGGPLEACVGVHIRSTDNVFDYGALERADPIFDRAKVSRLEGFRRLIDARAAAGEGIFLCSDNREVESALRARHVSVRCHPKSFDTHGYERFVERTYGRFARLRRALDRLRSLAGQAPRETSWRTTSVADALVDLLLLGRCREIVGTYYSSFSEVAALIGDRPLAILEGERPVAHGFVDEIRRAAAVDPAAGCAG